MDQIVNALKTLGHSDRLRILALLSYGELTVSELVSILGMSQPRITQYIKSLEDADIIERLKEGSWVFSRINRNNQVVTALVVTVLNSLSESDPLLLADRRRLEDIRSARAKAANDFFATVAQDGGQLGDEYIPRKDIEAQIREVAGDGPFDFMVDLGTGTGRMLDVFADLVARGTGIDNNPDMLKVARHKISEDHMAHLSLRQADLRAAPLGDDVADIVTLHQVLHYLDEPEQALIEAARLLRPGGQVLITDFEAHNLDDFRKLYAHRRLGFTDVQMDNLLRQAGLITEDKRTIAAQDGQPDVKIWKAVKPETDSQRHESVGKS